MPVTAPIPAIQTKRGANSNITEILEEAAKDSASNRLKSGKFYCNECYSHQNRDEQQMQSNCVPPTPFKCLETEFTKLP